MLPQMSSKRYIKSRRSDQHRPLSSSTRISISSCSPRCYGWRVVPLLAMVLLLVALLVFSFSSNHLFFTASHDPKQTIAVASSLPSMDIPSPIHHEVIQKEEEKAAHVGTETRGGDAAAAGSMTVVGRESRTELLNFHGNGRQGGGYPAVAIDSHVQQQMFNATDSWTMTADVSANGTLMKVMQALQSHPLTRLQKADRRAMSLEDQLLYMHSQSECEHVPIFTSMANVFSDLYWQL